MPSANSWPSARPSAAKFGVNPGSAPLFDVEVGENWRTPHSKS
jgi:hypothetical protein